VTDPVRPSGEAVADAPPPTEAPDPRRWWALAVLAAAQLMIVLDASIVNIALPSAQTDLDITNADRQWVVTAYTLAFGGLLLLGGRIADYTGRKRTFVIGLLGFAGASALGGFAPNQELLFAARALQGAFAALMAPAALSIVTVTSESAAGAISAAKAPCRARAANSSSWLGASPPMADAAAKPRRPTTNVRLRPV
jgi:MFS family permease